MLLYSLRADCKSVSDLGVKTRKIRALFRLLTSICDSDHIYFLHKFLSCIKNTRPITKLAYAFLDNRPIKVLQLHNSGLGR